VCTTTSPGNCCPLSWDSVLDRPAGGALSAGRRPESSTNCTASCSPNCTRPASWTGPGHVWTVPTSARKRGSRHRSVAGRPAEDGQQTPPDLRRTWHPAQGHHHRGQRHDVTQTLALVDGVPPVAGRPGRPRRRPEALLGDKGYDSNLNHRELRKRRILPVISRKGSPNIKGLGELRYVVEQTFALLHQFKRLAVRWERRTELHDAFVSLACSLICWRRLKKTNS